MLLTKTEIEGILKNNLPDISEENIRLAAQSLYEATGQWREVDFKKEDFGATYAVQCRDICALGQAYEEGLHIRAFVTRTDVNNQKDEK